ncbi:hypothetical protein [Natronorubrum halophilum]|uniref:hypothetical protein n=1 Tax=Natronorubrum halophilum TaxID=1702106 RepID=UPI000EF6BA19|nr:hypothetical protein [Natronorubrum halophilum]
MWTVIGALAVCLALVAITVSERGARVWNAVERAPIALRLGGLVCFVVLFVGATFAAIPSRASRLSFFAGGVLSLTVVTIAATVVTELVQPGR